ncbi:MAG: ribbon-helix-helix protein, CopG family [Chloroflexi bacterium]|nr:ribbon-helix-helix protein, CopG family [Chloroflexota bacterium]
MKRTTVLLEDELLDNLRRIAQERHSSTASVIREAISEYVAEWRREPEPPRENPLLGLIKLSETVGDKAVPMDLADGKDEEILKREAHPLYGWQTDNDGDC